MYEDFGETFIVGYFVFQYSIATFYSNKGKTGIMYQT